MKIQSTSEWRGIDPGVERRARGYSSVDEMRRIAERRDNYSFPLGSLGLVATFAGGSLAVLSKKHESLAKAIWFSGVGMGLAGFAGVVSAGIIQEDAYIIESAVEVGAVTVAPDEAITIQ